MKAYLVSEKLHNFERSQEPLKTLGIGVKNKFYDLMPHSILSSASDFREDWFKIKEILDKPTSNIQFINPLKEVKIREDKPYVSISLPFDPLNWFFFKSILSILDSHSPKKLTKRSIESHKLTLYINENA